MDPQHPFYARIMQGPCEEILCIQERWYGKRVIGDSRLHRRVAAGVGSLLLRASQSLLRYSEAPGATR